MAMLKLTLKKDEFEGLGAELKDFYEKTDDGYKLKVDGLPDTSGLEKKRDELLNESKTAKQRAKELEAELQELKDKKAQEANDFKSLYESEKNKRAEIEAKTQELNKVLGDKELGLTLSEFEKIAADGASKPLKHYVKSRLRYDDGQVRVLDENGNLTDMSIEDLQNEIKQDTAFSSLLKSDKGSGGGAGGSDQPPKEDSTNEAAEKAKQSGNLESFLQNSIKG